jgi:hypothetical protein
MQANALVPREVGRIKTKEDYPMKVQALIAASALALSSAVAIAQTAPSPADPSATQNAQPAPSASKPADPAASSNPSAAQPTAPTPSAPPAASEGASTGESGANPAGIPADPNTKQNVQPGPSNMTPSDPAAASKPDARVPTSP